MAHQASNIQALFFQLVNSGIHIFLFPAANDNPGSILSQSFSNRKSDSRIIKKN